jgi:hypothetical protein
MSHNDANIKNINGNILNMIIFNKLKTGDPVLDAIITTIMVSSITYLIQLFYNVLIKKCDKFHSFNIIDIFYKKHIVEYEGKISYNTNIYDCQIYQSSTFTDSFKALWKHIIENISNNDTIYHIKEYNFNNLLNIKNDTLYIVTQSNKFLISKEYQIYAITSLSSETEESDNKSKLNSNKITKINIQLFSYVNSIDTIKKYIENLTKKYLSNISDLRSNKHFIYTLIKSSYTENKCEMWSENLFSSTIKFSNLFFEEKNSFLQKLNFFQNNKEWYFEKGIPYTLGIGLYGPPGTGKTSVIKALANLTDREITIMSFKTLKTKNQLDTAFYEDRYCLDNKKGSIPFSNKIIVFEDIDCIGDIVLDRNKKKKKALVSNINDVSGNNIANIANISNILQDITNLNKEEEIAKLFNITKNANSEEPITLDDILNLWDGIRETPGRIMVITSNHYNDLDPALIRPGRIDISMELSYVSRNILKEVYEHLFNKSIDIKDLINIKDKFYSPAELISIYMSSERDPIRFIQRLELNQHLNNYTFDQM